MKRLNTFSSHWSHTDAASIWVCTCHCHQRGRWRGGAKPFTMTKRKWQGQTIACGITVTPYCKQAYLTWQLWIPIHVWSRCWRYFWYAVKKKSSLKTEGEVSSGSYLDAIGIGESGFSSILGMSNISLFIFLFPCIHYNGWMIWGFLVFEWSYCSIPTHDKRLWNAVHLANSQWFQTFQTQSVEQISLLPVISEKHRRQVGHVSVAFYVTVWQLKMHQGASFPSICAVIPTVLLIMFLLPQ